MAVKKKKITESTKDMTAAVSKTAASGVGLKVKGKVGSSGTVKIKSGTSSAKSGNVGLKSNKSRKTIGDTRQNTMRMWEENATSLLREMQQRLKKQPYDAQFTPEYFEKDRRTQLLLPKTIETSTASELAEQMNIFRKVQAGEYYRTNVGLGDYAQGSEAFALNDAINNNFTDAYLEAFKQKASEKDISDALDFWKQSAAQADPESDYYRRTMEDIKGLEEWAGNNFSSFAHREMTDSLSRVAAINVELRKLNTSEHDYNTIARALNNSDPVSAIRNDGEMRRIIGYDELEAQYGSNPDALYDAVLAKAYGIMDGTADMSSDSRREALETEKAGLLEQMNAANDKMNSLLKVENYQKQVESAFAKKAYNDFKIDPYEPFTEYEWSDPTTGAREMRNKVNLPSFNQILADPEGVAEKYNQALAAGAEPGLRQTIDLVRNMSEEERNLVRSSDNPEAYFNSTMKDAMLARQTQGYIDYTTELTDTNPVLANALQFAYRQLGDLQNIAGGIGLALGQAPNQYNQFEAMADTTQQRTIENATEATKWANFNVGGNTYNPFGLALQAGYAIGDEVLSKGIYGPLSLLKMGAASGSKEAIDTYNETGNALTALLTGGITGAAEYLSEGWGDKIFKDSDLMTNSIFEYIAKNSLTESAEELMSMGASEAGGFAAHLLTGEKNERQKRFEYYRDNGYTEGGAWLKMAEEFLAEAGQTAVVSFLAGAGMSGGNAVINAPARNAHFDYVGSKVAQQGNIVQLLEEGAKSSNRNARKLSERLMNKLLNNNGNMPGDAETKAETQVLADAVKQEKAAATKQPGEKPAEKTGATVTKPLPESEPEVTKQVQEHKERKETSITKPLPESEPEVTKQVVDKPVDKAGASVTKPRTESESVRKPEADTQKQADQQDEKKQTKPEMRTPDKRDIRRIGMVYEKVVRALDVDAKKSAREVAKNLNKRLKELGQPQIPAVTDAIAAAIKKEATPDQLDLVEVMAVKEGIVKELVEAYGGLKDRMATISAATDMHIKRNADGQPEKPAEQKPAYADPVNNEVSVEMDGETVTAAISSFTEGDDGKVAAVVGNKVVPISKLAHSDEGMGLLVQRAAELGNADAANALVENYSEDQEVGSYSSAFEQAYRYGFVGRSEMSVRRSALLDGLSDTQFKAAYEAGKNARASRPAVQASTAGGNVRFAGELGKKLRNLDPNQSNAIKAMTRLVKGLGTFNIEYFESDTDEQGNFTAENGSYNPNTNTIRIDINAGRYNKGDANSYALLRVASHELTHFLRAQNEEGYKQLMNFVADKLNSYVQTDFDASVLMKMDAQPDLDYDAAVEEVVADACEMMLQDSEAVKRFAQQNQTLFKKMVSWLHSFVDSVRKAFRGVSAESYEAKLLAKASGMQKLWDDALVQAFENVKAAQAARIQQQASEQAAPISYEADSHIDLRTDESIAQQQPFFNDFEELGAIFAYNMAQIIGQDVQQSIPGEKVFIWDSGKSQPDVTGQKRITTELIARYKDKYNWTWEQMGKLLEKFMDGCESGAIPDTMNMKRIEFMVDEALSKGYTDMSGTKIAPAAEYIRQKNRIEGSLGESAADNGGVSWMQYVFGEDVKFSMRSDVERTKNLIAVHNINAVKLGKALKLGGFPMPSIAIAKDNIGHQNFGDISLVFGRETIDPETNRKNKVYSADAWTPTFPKIEYEADPQAEKRIRNQLDKLSRGMESYLQDRLHRVMYGLDEYLNSHEGEQGLIEYVMQNYGLKAAYLEDKGQHVDMVKTAKRVGKEYSEAMAASYQKVIDLFDGDLEEARKLPLAQIREEYGAELEKIRPGITRIATAMGRFIQNAYDYQQTANQPAQYEMVEDYSATERSIDEQIDNAGYRAWVENLFKGIEGSSGVYNNKPLFTDSGNRRSFASTHMPVTVENIAKAMATQGNTKNSTGFHGIKSVRAATARSFRNVDEMHRYEGRIQNRTEAEAEALNEEMNNRLYALMKEVLSEKYPNGNTGIEYTYSEDALGEILLEIAEKKYSVASIQKSLAGYGYNVSTETAEAIKELFDDTANMPVNMYEAKPERAVGFEEVKFAVVPDDIDAQLRSQLEAVVPDVREYAAGDESARLEKLNSRGDVKFSKRIRDARYMEAYEAGDEVTAREIIHEAAVEAGYNPMKLYHGTNAFGFTEVDPSKSDDGISFFTTADDNVAETYAGSGARIRRVSGSNSDIRNIEELTNASDERMLELLQKHVDPRYELVSKEEQRELIEEEGELIRKRVIWKAEEFRNEHLNMFDDPVTIKAFDNVIEALDRLSFGMNFDQLERLYDAYAATLDELHAKSESVWSGLLWTIVDDVNPRYNNMLDFSQGSMFKIDDTASFSIEYANRRQAIGELSHKLFKGIYELYGRTDNLLEVKGHGASWSRLDGAAIGKPGQYVNTRSYAEYAKANGYDGVYFRDIVDMGGLTNYRASADVLTFFNPEDIKSADPFTFDENGDVIPPSKRFDSSKRDIRYSKRLTPQEMAMFYEKIGEIQQGKKLQFKVSRNGEHIFAIGNKLVYTDGNYERPRIRNVISINIDDETDIDAVRQVIFGYEEEVFTGEQARRILAESYGTKAVRGHDFGVRRPVSWKNGRGKGSNGRKISEGDFGKENGKENGKEIKYSRRTMTPEDREMLMSLADKYAETKAQKELVERYRKKVDELRTARVKLEETREDILRRQMIDTSSKIKITLEESQKNRQALAQQENRAKIYATQIDRLSEDIYKLLKSKTMQKVLDDVMFVVNNQEVQRRHAFIENYKEKRDTTDLRRKIRAVADDFDRRLKSPTEGKYIPKELALKVIALRELVDTSSNRKRSEESQAKLDEKIATIRAVYERYKSDSTFAYAFDEPVKDMLADLERRIAGKNIYNLKKADLKAIYDAMKAVKTQVTEATQLKAGAYAKDIFDGGQRMYQETAEAAPFAKGALGRFLNWQLTPDEFFSRLAGHKKDSAWSGVAKSFSDGTEKMLEVQRDAYYHFRKWTESREFDKLNSLHDKNMIDIGLKDANGKPVKITRGMMLEVYMHLSSEDNLKAMMYGGFSVPNIKKYYAGKVKEAYGTGSVNTVGMNAEIFDLRQRMYDDDVSDEELKEIKKKIEDAEAAGFDRMEQMRQTIEDKLTAWDRGLIEAVHEWNDGKSRDYINDVTMDMYGIKKAAVPNYYRINRDTAFVNTDFDSIQRNMNLENWGSLKERVPSKAPILLGDIAFTMDNSIKQMSRYVGYARAQRDFKKLYNISMPGMTGSVQKIVATKFGSGNHKFGASGEQYIENYIGSITGSRQVEGDFLSAIRRNLPRATMTMNVRVAVSQLSAIPKAAAEVGWGNMAKGINLKSMLSKQAKEDLAKRNVWFWTRYQGEGGQREFADMRSGGNLIDKGWNYLADSKVGRYLLNWNQNFDVAATSTMWNMAKAWAKSNGYKEGTAEFDKAVDAKYTAILRRTQAANTVSERSDLARGSGGINSILTMYKSEAFANFNLLYDSVVKMRKYGADLKAGKNGVTRADVTAARKGFANALTSVVIGASVTNALIKLLVNALMGTMSAYRDDDDEITGASVTDAIIREVISDMAGMVVLGGDIYEFFEAKVTGGYYSAPGDAALQELGNVVNAAMNLDADSTLEDWQNAGEKVFFAACNMLGIPAKTMQRQGEGIKNTIRDIGNGEFLSWEAGADRSNSTNYKRLLKAGLEGDKAKWDETYSEIKEKYLETEGKEMTEKEFISKLKSEIGSQYKDGELSKEDATKLLKAHTDVNDEHKLFWQFDKWDYAIANDGTEGYAVFNRLEDAVASKQSGEIKQSIKFYTQHGYAEKDVLGEVKSKAKKLYCEGKLTWSQGLKILLDHCNNSSNNYDNEHVQYWLKREWDYAKKNDGSSDGYAKYGDFYDAVENNKSTDKWVDELFEHNKSEKDARSAAMSSISARYKNDYIDAVAAGNQRLANQILEWALRAYEAIGLNRNKQLRYIQKNWVEDEDE